MKVQQFIILLAVLLMTSHLSGHEWYSEHSVLGREGRFTSTLRARATGQWDRLTYYFQAGDELQIATLNGSLDRSSYAHVGPGISFKFGPASLFNEFRVRQPLEKNSRLNTIDYRTLLVLGHFSETASTSGVSLFFEPYSEFLFSTADRNNLSFGGFIRAGLRKRIGKIPLDLFVEPYAALDTVGHFYQNRADVKLSVRASLSSDVVTFSLIGSLLQNHNLNFLIREPNPYANRNTGFRILLVAGGNL